MPRNFRTEASSYFLTAMLAFVRMVRVGKPALYQGLHWGNDQNGRPRRSVSAAQATISLMVQTAYYGSHSQRIPALPNMAVSAVSGGSIRMEHLVLLIALVVIGTVALLR
jgi:hypothetical protein